MKTLLSIALVAVLSGSVGCKKCTDAELQQKLTTLNNQEAVELNNPNLTSSQVTAIGKKYDRYRTNAENDCK